MVRNSRAFTIIEILISIVVLAMVALTTSSISTMMVKASATSERSQERMSLGYELNAILNNPALCSDSLRGTISAEGADLSLMFGTSNVNSKGMPVGGGIVISAGSVFGMHMVDKVKLRNVSPFGKDFRADIELSGKNITQVFGSQEFINRGTIYYEVDKSTPPRILRCLGAANDNASICAALGGSWDKTKKICDQCIYLGGITMGDGSCLMNAGANTGFAWQLGSWDRCSSKIQARSVECIDASSGEVSSPTSCPPPKPDAWKSCSPYDWQIGAWGACSQGSQSRPVRCIELTSLNAVAESNCNTDKPSTSQICMGRWVAGSGFLQGYCYDPLGCTPPHGPYKTSVPTYVDPNSKDIKPCLIPRLACGFAGSCIVGSQEIDSISVDCVVMASTANADFLCTCVP